MISCFRISSQDKGYTNLIGRTHAELDLIRQNDVENFFAAQRPAYVFLASARWVFRESPRSGVIWSIFGHWDIWQFV